MGEIKSTSFRINEDDNEKFKQFTAEFNNQAEAFQAIMQTVEMARAKGQIKDRAKEIEVFQDTMNRAMGMFLNSLEVNQTSEERIREELSKEIHLKDDTISNINEQLQKIKLDKVEFERKSKELSNDLEEAKKVINGWIESNDKLKKDLDDKQKAIDVLTSNNINQLQQLEEYKDLKSTNELLLKQLDEINTKCLVFENENKQLKDKIKNDEDILAFYKNNNSDLKGDIESYKEDIKDLEAKHDKHIEELEIKHSKKIEEIKAEYEKSLEKEKIISDKYQVDISNLDAKYQNQIKEIKAEHANALKKEIDLVKDQLINKHSLELDKKDLAIERLNNEIEKLNPKKPRNTKTDKGTETK